MQDGKFYENLNVKTRIGSLLFDILLGSGFSDINDSRPSEKHNHSSYEIHFIVKGEGVLCVDNTEIELCPGSFFIIGPGVYHSIRQNAQNPMLRYHMKFEYSAVKNPDSFFPAIENANIQEILSNIRCVYLSDTSNNITLIQEIHRELELKAIGCYSKIQCLFIQIIINLLRCISLGSDRKYSLPQKVKDDQRSSIIESFFDNYQSDLTIEQLASLLNLSSKQTNRILKRLYDTSFKQKLLDIRIEVAKDLLKNSRDSIEFISERVGYSLEKNFRMVFKRKTGLTPLRFRKNAESNKYIS